MPRAAVCRRFAEPLAVEQVDARSGPGRARCGPGRRRARSATATSPTRRRLGRRRCRPCSATRRAASSWRWAPASRRRGPGERVVVSLVRYCGSCARCRARRAGAVQRRFRLDPARPIRAAGGAPVARACAAARSPSRCVVHASQAVADPGTTCRRERAALIACAVMTGVGAVRQHAARARRASQWSVIGAGGVGLNAIQGAALAGARRGHRGRRRPTEKLAAARRRSARPTPSTPPGRPGGAVRAADRRRGADCVDRHRRAPRRGRAGARAALAAAARWWCVGMPPSGRPAAFDAGATRASTASASSAASWDRPGPRARHPAHRRALPRRDG